MKIHVMNAQLATQHIAAIGKLSGYPSDPYTSIQIWMKLDRLERQAHRLATQACNGEKPFNISYDDEGNDQADKLFIPILEKVKNLLPNAKTVFINHDPRGYALKIKDEEAIEAGLHRDFGGYGILAPDYSNKP